MTTNAINSFTIKGSIVAIVTPMRVDGSIDEDSFAALIEWHIDAGTSAILVAGTTGESPTLSIDEHQNLIAQAVHLSDNRIPIIAGVGANSTTEACELTQHAAADGATAGLSVIPYYNKPTQEGLFRHFSAIADCSDMPVILYDVPSRCITTFDITTLERLAAHPRIIGIKDATGDNARAQAQRKALPDDFLLYSGDDKTCADFMLNGGDGVISVTANIAPDAMRKMTQAALDGNSSLAHEIDSSMQPFHKAQAAQSNPIPVKWALADSGRIDGGIRLPLVSLETQYHETVRQAAQQSQQGY